VYLKSIKKLCEYGFKITEENIETILLINEDSFEKNERSSTKRGYRKNLGRFK